MVPKSSAFSEFDSVCFHFEPCSIGHCSPPLKALPYNALPVRRFLLLHFDLHKVLLPSTPCTKIKRSLWKIHSLEMTAPQILLSHRWGCFPSNQHWEQGKKPKPQFFSCPLVWKEQEWKSNSFHLQLSLHLPPAYFLVLNDASSSSYTMFLRILNA